MESNNETKIVNSKAWDEFRSSGFLWWINMLLHTFGWAIIIDVNEKGEITNAYPSRVKFRGFSEASNTIGYSKVSKFMKENAKDLYNEVNNKL